MARLLLCSVSIAHGSTQTIAFATDSYPVHLTPFPEAEAIALARSIAPLELSDPDDVVQRRKR
jgi:hypothetical protein